MNLRAKIAVAAGVLLLAGCRELPHYFTSDTTIARAGGKELKIVFIADYNISTLDNGYCYHGLCTPTITKDLDSPYEKAE